MLYTELQKIAPPLAAFLEDVAPNLKEEDITVVKPKSIIRSIRGRGKCYLFAYRNPIGKGKPELPYYHMFPMVFSMEMQKEHLIGFNPFYLPPSLREELIDNVMNKMIGNVEDPDSRILISFKLLNKYRRRLGGIFPCIKKYAHVRMSPIVLEMKPTLWREFYLGEISKKHELMFRGRSVKSIWSESRRIAIEERRKTV